MMVVHDDDDTNPDVPQERSRHVPVLSSSVYGWRVNKPLEPPYKKNVRVQLIKKGFFRSRGTGIPLQTEMAELN